MSKLFYLFIFFITLINPNSIPSAVQVWPHGVVYYDIAPGVKIKQQVTLYRAMQTWTKYTGVRFIYRPTAINKVIVQNGPGCAAALGFNGGPQIMRLGPKCGYRAALHELGHTLGLIHEHQRWDRDFYIKIQSKCFENNSISIIHNFFRLPIGIFPTYGEYDYTSIMHYNSTAFSKNVDCRTILRYYKVSPAKKYRGLSKTDIKRIKFMYFWELKK